DAQHGLIQRRYQLDRRCPACRVLQLGDVDRALVLVVHGFDCQQSRLGGVVAKENGKKVAIAWYRREDYELILSVMDDRSIFPPTYNEWLRRAEQIILVE